MKRLLQAIHHRKPLNRGTEYTTVFLKKKELKTRQCVYISQDMHSIVTQIIQIFSDREVTVGSYIDNVLRQHFEIYREEITELYKKELSKKNGKNLIEF